MTTGVQCRNDPRCTCRYHQAIREAARWRQLLSASQASRQAEPEAEAG
jgi:hypothetical protein